jgi:hypothetical protein
MYRVPPHMAGKNITYQAWVKKEQETHRRNVKTMSSHLIDSGAMKPPKRVAVLEANPRKQKLEAERIQAIEAENARLLQKMTKIMDQGPQFTVLHRSKVFISNAVSRKFVATKIAERNLEFCERINKVKPYYNTKKWDEERKVTEHILKGMGLYPYHPPQPKRWQDYFEAEGEEDAHDPGVEEELDRQWVQSLASFSNRPSQINEELSRSDSFSPKSLRRPKGDNWMLPGLARPGQYSKDGSGRVLQTLSDGRMEQLSSDSPSTGNAASVAARSGLRLQPLAKTPTIEAVPRRNDTPVLNSRPNSREVLAPTAATAADRANLWSSDGNQGERGRANAGQQQGPQMFLRNDEPDDERQADHSRINDPTEQMPSRAAVQQHEAASDSHSVCSLDNTSNSGSHAATIDSAPDPDSAPSPGDESDAAAAESLPHGDARSAVSVAATVVESDATPKHSDVAEVSALSGEQRDAEADVDLSARASMPDTPDSGAVAAAEGPITEDDVGAAVPTAAAVDTATAASAPCDTDAAPSDTGPATAMSPAADADCSFSLEDGSQEPDQQRAAAEPDVGSLSIDATTVSPVPSASEDADAGPPLTSDADVAPQRAAAADQSED